MVIYAARKGSYFGTRREEGLIPAYNCISKSTKGVPKTVITEGLKKWNRNFWTMFETLATFVLDNIVGDIRTTFMPRVF